jgi:hypothetical protein
MNAAIYQLPVDLRGMVRSGFVCEVNIVLLHVLVIYGGFYNVMGIPDLRTGHLLKT